MEQAQLATEQADSLISQLDEEQKLLAKVWKHLVSGILRLGIYYSSGFSFPVWLLNFLIIPDVRVAVFVLFGMMKYDLNTFKTGFPSSELRVSPVLKGLRRQLYLNLCHILVNIMATG